MHSSQPTVLTIPDRHGVHQYMSPLRSVHIQPDRNLTFSDRLMANDEFLLIDVSSAFAFASVHPTDRVPRATSISTQLMAHTVSDLSILLLCIVC